MVEYSRARLNMVNSQLATNRVADPRVLEAMATVPREEFLPKPLRGVAYVDEDIPLGDGRYLIEPAVLARMIQALAVKPSDIALDVACGPGYSTAVLASLCSAAVGLESSPALAKTATQTLSRLGVDTAVVIEGPLQGGYPKQAPYDVILIGGAVAAVPETLTAQLAEGGRMAVVLTERAGRGIAQVGRATVIERRGGHLARRVLFDAGIPALKEFEPAPEFVF